MRDLCSYEGRSEVIMKSGDKDMVFYEQCILTADLLGTEHMDKAGQVFKSFLENF